MRKYKETIYDYEATFDLNGAGYTVTVEKLPGLVTEGDNLKNAKEMAKDAIRCYLEALLKDQKTNVTKIRKQRIRVTV